MIFLNIKHKCLQEHGHRGDDITHLSLMSKSILPGNFKDIYELKWEERKQWNQTVFPFIVWSPELLDYRENLFSIQTEEHLTPQPTSILTQFHKSISCTVFEKRPILTQQYFHSFAAGENDFLKLY